MYPRQEETVAYTQMLIMYFFSRYIPLANSGSLPFLCPLSKLNYLRWAYFTQKELPLKEEVRSGTSKISQML